MPGQWNETNTFSRFNASAATALYARVIIDAANGEIDVADGTDGVAGDGVATLQAFAAGDQMGVRLFNSGGTFPGIAADAVTAGDALYAAAGGKVKATAGGSVVVIGKALSAGSGDGAYIEWIPDQIA